MKPAHVAIDKVVHHPRMRIDDFSVGYYDRVEDRVIEMPLAEFLDSEIPYHRLRYIKKKSVVVWNREKRVDNL